MAMAGFPLYLGGMTLGSIKLWHKVGETWGVWPKRVVGVCLGIALPEGDDDFSGDMMVFFLSYLGYKKLLMGRFSSPMI